MGLMQEALCDGARCFLRTAILFFEQTACCLFRMGSSNTQLLGSFWQGLSRFNSIQPAAQPLPSARAQSSVPAVHRL